MKKLLSWTSISLSVFTNFNSLRKRDVSCSLLSQHRQHRLFIFETEDFDPDEGYVVRGKWPNEKAFRDYLKTEFGDMSDYKVIDLIAQGAQAETLDAKALADLAEQL